MNIAVVGAGKMGLPLACVFADRGADVVACDVNRGVVEAVNRGESLIDEPGVPELLKRVVASGKLRATTQTTAAAGAAEVVIIIVPVLLTPERKADTAVIETVSWEIAAGLKRGTLVCYETTLPIGGTRRLGRILESSGLKAGTNFDLAFSPERVKSRLVISRLTEQPKIVGGITPAAAQRAADFYEQRLGVKTINVGTLEAAEMVKLGGMVYRDVNIALANELARYCEAAGVDLSRIIAAINTDGEANLLTPGIGVGGHCTPVYPYFLIQEGEALGAATDIVSLSRRLNEAQPAFALDRLERVWRPTRGRRVMILGLGFRPRVKEHACSPAFPLRRELSQRGARVTLCDPLYSPDEIKALGFAPATLDDAPAPEAIILNTAHDEFAAIDFAALAARGLEAAVDGRNLWDADKVRAAGLIYLGIGRP